MELETVPSMIKFRMLLKLLLNVWHKRMGQSNKKKFRNSKTKKVTEQLELVKLNPLLSGKLTK